MKLEWISSLSSTRVIFSDNNELQYLCKCWNKSKINTKSILQDSSTDDISADMFDYINRYLQSLPIEKVLEIESHYKNIYYLIEERATVLQLNKTLNIAINNLLHLIDWVSFSDWLRKFGGLNLEIGRKDTLDEKDSAEITYFTDEYDELVFFSVLLKLIIPIWGMYYSAMNKVLGEDRVLIAAIDLLRNTYMEENPAFQKLQDYTYNFSSTRTKNTGFSIINDIGTGEIPEYMLAIAIWKKVCIYDDRSQTKSVIQNVHHILKEKCANIIMEAPKQKQKNNANGEELSIVETYKLIQRIPPSIEVMVTYYISILPKRFQKVDRNEIYRVRQAIPLGLPILSYHIPILAIVLGDKIGGRNLQLITYETLLNVIAIANVILRNLNFHTLAELIITAPEEKDIFSLNFTGNKTQNIIPLATMNSLNAVYLHTLFHNPGVKLIEAIIKEVNGYSFTLTSPIEEISNEIANLLILKGSSYAK